MNDQISWESSLIKKFSASNHFKLLNQLRNEVKKYPLKKKNTASLEKKDSNYLNKSKLNNDQQQNQSLSKKSNLTNSNYINNTTISFNNSKNFSIYNNTSNDSIVNKNENLSVDQSKSLEPSLSPSDKDPLNQIDIK